MLPFLIFTKPAELHTLPERQDSRVLKVACWRCDLYWQRGCNL